MPIQVCFVAINAYPTIDSSISGPIGGIETRSWLFARSLTEYPDFNVSFVVRHISQLHQPTYKGVKLHLLKDRLFNVRQSILSRLKRSPDFPWYAISPFRLSDLYYLPQIARQKLLRKIRNRDSYFSVFETIDAEIFLTFGVNSVSAEVIKLAKRKAVPSVLFLGSDSDLDERYQAGSNFVSEYRDSAEICLWILQNSDHILCQTEQQQHLLSDRFHRDSQVIRNPIDLKQWDEFSQRKLPQKYDQNLSRFALWIGRADGVHKRPQDLLELARLSPSVIYLMVLNPRDDVLEAKIKTTAPQNVHIVERVPFKLMPALFRKAAVLVNSSSLEGFPNTFLQAAASRIPIASLNVEQEFLQKSNGGFCANGDLDKLATFVQKVWDGTTPPQHGREYVEQHHGLEQQTTNLADVLKSNIQHKSSS